MRLKIEIGGIVQGVGFRPLIYRLATKQGLLGSVCNDANAVVIELEGESTAIEAFLDELLTHPPKNSRIYSIKKEQIPQRNSKRFSIIHAKNSPNVNFFKTMFLSDLALCESCLLEMKNPNNRRYRDAFISCTECGVRYSITKSLPFERETTSMAPFEMCTECEGEYKDPASRRFHMQGISCPECSPLLSFGETSRSVTELIESLSSSLKRAEIVALKGIGGFHLLCDARNEQSILELREVKKREAKPFAVMFQNIEEIEKACLLSPHERELLLSSASPIVLLERKKNANIADSVAPNIETLGVFLPYTPLHYLLFETLDFPLVVTSANLSGMPIISKKESLFEHFGTLKNNTLSHNREIASSCDDSIVMSVLGESVMLRLGRGFAPLSLQRKKRSSKKILALGAEQKSAFSLAFDEYMILSPYLGDLNSLEMFEYFIKTLERFLEIYAFVPDVIVCDMHTEYETSKWAKAYAAKHVDVELLEVQHHHAHALACMAEHGLESEALAFCFDGSGYGQEGGESSVWGGEVLRVTPTTFKRHYHLQNFSLLGGERAIKEPRRIALALLFELYTIEEIMKMQLPLINSFTNTELRAYHAMWRKNLSAPKSSSIGRLFDGVYALSQNPKALEMLSYEGESGFILEANARECDSNEHYNYSTDEDVIGFEAMIKEILHEKKKKQIAAKFINTLVEIIVRISKRHSELPVILSGGVFQNKTLLQKTIAKFKKEKINYYIQNKTPINDGGISLGQAYYALYASKKANLL